MTSDDDAPATDPSGADTAPQDRSEAARAGGDQSAGRHAPDPTDTADSAAPTHTADASTPPVAPGPGPDHADIAGLPYEAARDELAAIVARLEAGRTDLEESMRLWERGEALAAHCSRWLDGAQERLERRMGETPTDA